MTIAQTFAAAAPASYAGVLYLRAEVPSLSSDAVTWVHIAREGRWLGHPQGAFEFTRQRFEEMERNFRRRLGTPLKVNFEHEDHVEPGQPKPARGRVHDLAVRPDGLWGLVEFGPEARAGYEAGGWRFASAEVSLDGVDRETGERCGAVMTALALTDDPWVLGLNPIHLSLSASAAAAAPVNTDPQPKDLAMEHDNDKERDLGGEQPERDLASGDTPDEERDLDGEGGAPPPSAKSPAEGQLEALASAAGMTLEELLAAMVAKQDAVIGLLTGNAGGGDLEVALSATRTQLATHKSKLGETQQRLLSAQTQLEAYRKRDAEAKVNKLIEQGRLLDTGKSFATKLYLSSPKDFQAFAQGLPQVVPTGQHASAPEVDPGTTTGDQPPVSTELESEIEALNKRLLSANLPEGERKKILDKYRSDSLRLA